MSTNNPDNNPDRSGLSPIAAYVGGALVLVSVALAVMFPLLPATVSNSTFLLFIASAMPSVGGVIVLNSNIRQAIPIVRYGAMVVAGLIMAFLLGCFAVAVLGWSGTIREGGEEFGLVVATVLFFLFAGGIEDLLKAITKWQHGLGVCIWLGNIIAMTAVVEVWTQGHLLESDAILTSAFAVVYSSLSFTKYISLAISSHGSRIVQVLLGTFACIAVALGWIYIATLTHPVLLPNRLLDASLYAMAGEFGVSYVVDGMIRNKDIPLRRFLFSMGYQALLMVGSGLVGGLLPSGAAPLVIGLVIMESLPNLPGAIDIATELKGRGWIWWFGVVLVGLIFFSAISILIQKYAVLGGGISICLLQAIPWMQVGITACRKWARNPDQALTLFISVLLIATCISVSLAFWIIRFGYSESDLVAVWYAIARVPSALSLGCFGLLGVLLVGGTDRATDRAWRYLLLLTSGAVGIGFVWLVIALFTGGAGALIAPGLMMQVSGGINVALVYTGFNSSTFQAKADSALASRHQ